MTIQKKVRGREGETYLKDPNQIDSNRNRLKSTQIDSNCGR
jgi:hypothetical protein